jgi:CheY-like chemotaxis protein
MTMPIILVVEDDTETRQALGEILTALFPASRILMSESGEAGLELIRRTRPSVVLLDLNLRGIHGFEFADRVRALDGGVPSPPIVALTGDLSPATLMKAEALGFAGFLHKPADIDRLETVLKPFLDRLSPN